MADDRLSIERVEGLRPLLLVPAVVWAALVVSVVLYAVIGWIIVGSGTAGPAEPVPDAMLYGLVGAAVVVTAIIPPVRRTLMPPSSPRGATSLPTGVARAVAGRYLVVIIVSAALSESIALFGLVLTMIGHDVSYVLALGLLAIINLVVYRPTAEQLRGLLRAAE